MNVVNILTEYVNIFTWGMLGVNLLYIFLPKVVTLGEISEFNLFIFK